MAIVSHLSASVIKGFRGVLDFYYWRGRAVCRRWPKPGRQPNTHAQLVSRAAFRASRYDLKKMSGAVRAAWAPPFTGRRQAWLDYYTGMYLSFFKQSGRYPPVIYDFKVEYHL